MNPILKVFIGISAASGVIMFLFWGKIDVPGYLMFMSSYVIMGLITVYHEFLQPSNWPVSVQILEKRYGSYKLKRTRAKRIKDKFGKYKYKIMGEGETKPFDFKHIETIKTSGFRSEDVLFLYSAAPGQWHPITFEKYKQKLKEAGEEVENLGVKVIPQELLNFSIETHREKYMAHPDKQKGWAAILTNPSVMATMFAMAVFIIIIANMVYVQEVVPEMQKRYDALITATDRQLSVYDKILERSDAILLRLQGYEGVASIPPPPPPNTTG